jgi:antitoxin component of MazEF toxin-antitoxin module
MTTITTKLVKDGNSVAIRIPKTVLVMSGLKGNVRMEVKRGQVIISPTLSPRSDWKERIADIMATNPSANRIDSELDDWEETLEDGLSKRY